VDTATVWLTHNAERMGTSFRVVAKFFRNEDTVPNQGGTATPNR